MDPGFLGLPKNWPGVRHCLETREGPLIKLASIDPVVMDADDLQSMLEANGELMVNVAEFEQPLELHLHDTEIGEESVRLTLTDGVLNFDIDEVTGAWQHTHSLADLGLE